MPRLGRRENVSGGKPKCRRNAAVPIASKQRVEEKTQAHHHRTFDDARGEGEEEGQRANGMGGDSSERAAFPNGLSRARQIEGLQVAQTAVDQATVTRL